MPTALYVKERSGEILISEIDARAILWCVCAGCKRCDRGRFRAIVPLAGLKGWGQPQK